MQYKDKSKNYRYILYARKSTESEDRQVASIESQINEMKKVAEEYGFKIVQVMSEATSGFKTGRLVFNEMIEMIQEGKAEGILCWKLSRLSRNPEDAGKIMGLIQRGEISHIRTYSRDWYPTDNVMMMYVEFGLNNQFSIDLREDTARGMRQKAERGWKPTARLPIGYLHNMYNKKTSPLPENEIINDPDRFDLTKLGLELVASRAMSPAQALEYINKQGLRTKYGKPLQSGSFHNIMRNEFYYGMFEHPEGSGNWFTGKHTPMITEEQFNSIQNVLGNNSVSRSVISPFSYTGLMRCGECGNFVTAETKTKILKSTGEKKQYTYYRCTKWKGHCSQKCIELSKLEAQFAERIQHINIPTEFAEWAIEELKKEHEKEKASRGISTRLNSANYDECLKKMDRLVESYLNGDTPHDIYKAKIAELEKEKRLVKGMIDHTDERVDEWLKKAEDILHFAINAKSEFENGSLEKKKAIVAYLGSNLILKDNLIDITVQKPIEVVGKYAEQANALLDSLEPMVCVDAMAKYKSSLSENSIWGGQRVLNPSPPHPQCGALPNELWPPRVSTRLFYHESQRSDLIMVKLSYLTSETRAQL